jgi:hypothetical protein
VTDVYFAKPDGSGVTGATNNFNSGTKIHTPCDSVTSYDAADGTASDGKWYSHDLVTSGTLSFFNEDAGKIATISAVLCGESLTKEDLPAAAQEIIDLVNYGGWFSDDAIFQNSVSVPGVPFGPTAYAADVMLYPRMLHYGSVETTILARILPTILITTEDREVDGGIADGLDDGIISTADLIPDEEGVTETVDDFVIVSTNSPMGYRLSMRAKTDTAMLFAPDPFDQSTYVNTHTIPALTGTTITTPQALVIDTAGGNSAVWGYAVPEHANYVSGRYTGLTLNDVVIKEKAGTALRDYTTVTYGVKANGAQASGTYAGVVVYTAVALE